SVGEVAERCGKSERRASSPAKRGGGTTGWIPYNSLFDSFNAKKVSTAVAHDCTAPLIGGKHHFLLRRLHSLTGIVFGGYLVVHLTVNATLARFEGGRYQALVAQIPH